MRRERQGGSIAVEYVLSVAIFIVCVVVGTTGEEGVAETFLAAFRDIYKNFSAMVGNMDMTP